MARSFASIGTAARSFKDLLFRRGEPRFLVFDCLYCEGGNLRYLPPSERKHRLRGIVPNLRERLLYCDHVETVGEALLRFACERDLEGIVAKRKSTLLCDRSTS
jgi:ATP-dependent DNA ligase